jgi:hypothetical protein
MTAGMFASPHAQPIGLWSGLARIFEALELMSEEDQARALEFIYNPEESELGQRRPGRRLRPVR